VKSIGDRYLADEYFEKNPTWDMEDSPWKAERVAQILDSEGIVPDNICEVGCGAGKVLESLATKYPNTEFRGYDIAPAASKFWEQIDHPHIRFSLGNFSVIDNNHYDVLLLLDVLEHVPDPHDFLSKVRERADYFIVHFPLDLSASSVLRESPLLLVRRKVGHIHYFTKGLALELLNECGLDVIESRYSGAAFNAPQASLRTRLAQIPRRVAYMLNKDWGVRLFGGETLMVLAKPK